MESWKKVLAGLLALTLTLGMLPTGAMAAQTGEETVAEQEAETVPETEAAQETAAVEEPPAPTVPEETPAATGETVPATEEPVPTAEETVPATEETVPVTEETVPTTEETVPTERVITGFGSLAEDVAGQALPVGSLESDILLPETITATVDGEEISLPVTWISEAPFDSTQPETVFLYTPVLPEGYTLLEGVTPPQIQVAVIEPVMTMAEAVQSGTCGPNLTWTLDEEGTLTVSGTGEMYSSPFAGIKGSIRSVILEPGVTSIGDDAFYRCSSLESVTLPASLTSIGNLAFRECTSLTSIEIPTGVTSLGKHAFYECSSLTSIEIPDGVTSIGWCTFYGCSSLTSITLPTGLTSIEDSLFSGCTSLASIKLPAGLTSVGQAAFNSCSSLTSIEIPAGVTSIGDSAFYSCSSLTSIKIPNGVTSIGGGAFEGCSSLTSIEIPASVTSIEDFTFNWCSSLTSIKLPAGVTSIGKGAFKECGNLTSITLPASLTSIGNGVFRNCSKLASIKIPDGVTSIESAAFSGCSSLTSITLPSGLTSIEDSLFYGCSSLTSIKIPAGVTSIGSTAFDGCSSLTSIKIPTKVTSIENGAFESCTSLTSIEIPAGVTSIGDFTFNWCTSLTSIKLPSSVTSIGKYAFKQCVQLASVKLPAGVTFIGDGAFANCSSLVSLSLPDGLTSIGDSFFYGCSSLTSIKVPDRVTSIGSAAFNSCTKLASIEIPASVTSVGHGAFELCSSLRSIAIPVGVTSIEDWTFNFCESLTSIAIPNGVTSIGNNAFKDCGSLTSIQIPDGVTFIGDGAFNNCSSLPSIGLPNTLTSIGTWAFVHCTSLESIEIPAGVTSIGEDAFAYTGVKAILLPETLTQIGSGAFAESPLTTVFYRGSEAQAEALKTQHAGSDNDALVNAQWFCNAQGSLAELLQPDEEDPNDGLTWKISAKGVLTIQGSGPMPNYTYSNRAPWDDRRSSITSVVIEEGITSVGDRAFYDWSSSGGYGKITSVSIPHTAEFIGLDAFSYCTGLKSIQIPDGVTTMVDAFRFCTGLKSVVIPDSVTNIYRTFQGCTGLTSVKIPKSITDMDKAFQNCTGLTSVTLENGLGVVGGFEGCTALREIVIPGTVLGIGYRCFADCIALETATILHGDNATRERWIGRQAFRNCTNLRSVTIPDDVGQISISAFQNCASLTSVETAADIGDYAFDQCSGLKSVSLRYGCSSIGSCAFTNCLLLKQVTLPQGLTSIGDKAFAYGFKFNLDFHGEAPTLSPSAFTNVWATVHYPADLASWEGVAGQNYGGTLTWVGYSPKSYTLRYNANGGTGGMADRTGLEASAAYTLDACKFTKHGCGFLGWNTKPDGTGWFYFPEDDQFTYTPENDGEIVTLYAQWDDPRFDVTYVLKGDGAVNHPDNPATYAVAELPVSLKAPTWAHHTFLGWYTDAACTKRVTAITGSKGEPRTFYAKWEDTPYTVSWRNGDTVLRQDTYLYGKVPEYVGGTPVREPDLEYSYLFEGWALEPEGSVVEVFSPVEGNTVYYAVFTPTDRIYRIQYVLNGGDNSEDNPSGYAKNTGFTLAEPTKDGYTFDGWYATSDYTQPVTEITESDRGDKILYAKWEADTCTVTYDLGDDSSVSKAQNNTANPVYLTATGAPVALKNPTRTGYTFDGWFNGDTKVTKVSFLDGTRDEATGEYTLDLTAQWTPVEYKITYKNVAKGEYNPNPGTFTIEGMALAPMEREGFDFGRWWTDSKCVKQEITAISGGTTTKMTVYAKWIARSYTVTFDPQVPPEAVFSGKEMKALTVACGKTVTLPACAYKCDGYLFQGWADEDGRCFADRAKVRDLSIEDDGTVTLYAQWAAAGEEYEIFFDANGGAGGREDPLPATYGKAVKLPAAKAQSLSRPGYTFAGWNTEPDGTGLAYKDGASVKGIRDQGQAITLYAQWKPVTYKISYTMNSGKKTGSYPTAYTVESEDIGLPTPTRTGYRFVGWYENSKFNGDPVTVIPAEKAANVKLYAKFVRNRYTLVLDHGIGEDGIVPKHCEYGVSIRLGDAGTARPGYTFLNWVDENGKTYKNKASVKNLTLVDGGSVTLTARWAKSKYTVLFDANGGSGPMGQVLGTYGKAVKLPANKLTHKDCVFVGWNTEKDGTGTAYKDKASAKLTPDEGGQVILYAQWSPETYTVVLDANCGPGSSLKACPGYPRTKGKTLPSNPFARNGYTFTGWNTKADGSGKAYKNKASVKGLCTTDAGVVTLYAQWKLVTYKITYTLSGGKNPKGAPKSYYVTSGTVALPTPERKGYRFNGWIDRSNDQRVPLIDAGTARSYKLMATWIPD